MIFDENSLLRLYERVISTFVISAQKWMLIEECGELINAISKSLRGRSTNKDVITELADVCIMVEQMALFLGWENFKAEKERKLLRLQERLSVNSKI